MLARRGCGFSDAVRRRAAVFDLASAARMQLQCRSVASYGRVTDEDRRWWMVHLDCAPDVHPGTFASWLDSCGTHTTKKLVERNVWTIEQVAALSSDQVDELRYREGCLHMDVVWEHARTILSLLKTRQSSTGSDTALQERITALRKKRELERRKEQLLQDRDLAVADRQERLEALRKTIALKKQQLQQQQERASRAGRSDSATAEDDTGASEILNDSKTPPGS